jgi:hypothetical protein
VKARWPWLGLLAVLGAAAATALWVGAGRVRDSRVFSQEYRVRCPQGTNYFIQVGEVTVGKVQTGCVLIVAVRIRNPNDHELVLKRDWFILADHDRDYFQPIPTGDQGPWIRVPPHGVREKELLDFVVPDDTLDGLIALGVGHHYFVMIKSPKPLRQPLTAGQFYYFRQRDW